MNLEKALLLAGIILALILTIFSYAYVDLNLTLSQNSYALKFTALMQSLGYFQRPSATFIYILIIIVMLALFALNLSLFYKNKLSAKYLKGSLFSSVLILIFAYPFLSSDIFNYMFDAKIITEYGSNPYTNRPLDFPGDEWLRFMRWIHRYSPYGPFWLGISIIPSIVGFGKFIATLFAFKVFIASFHLLNSYLIYKTLKIINPQRALFGTSFYALNPLFLIEGVVNAHNDVVLATFLLSSIYFYLAKKRVISYFALIFGTLIKYIPALNIPWLILALFSPKLRNGKKIKPEHLIYLNLATMAAFTFIFSTIPISVPFVSSGATQVQFQPWYLFWTIPYLSLIPSPLILFSGILISLGAFTRYLPFLYFGDWSQPGTIEFIKVAILLPVILVVLVAPLKMILKK